MLRESFKKLLPIDLRDFFSFLSPNLRGILAIFFFSSLAFFHEASNQERKRKTEGFNYKLIEIRRQNQKFFTQDWVQFLLSSNFLGNLGEASRKFVHHHIRCQRIYFSGLSDGFGDCGPSIILDQEMNEGWTNGPNKTLLLKDDFSPGFQVITVLDNPNDYKITGGLVSDIPTSLKIAKVAIFSAAKSTVIVFLIVLFLLLLLYFYARTELALDEVHDLKKGYVGLKNIAFKIKSLVENSDLSGAKKLSRDLELVSELEESFSHSNKGASQKLESFSLKGLLQDFYDAFFFEREISLFNPPEIDKSVFVLIEKQVFNRVFLNAFANAYEVAASIPGSSINLALLEGVDRITFVLTNSIPTSFNLKDIELRKGRGINITEKMMSSLRFIYETSRPHPNDVGIIKTGDKFIISFTFPLCRRSLCPDI